MKKKALVLCAAGCGNKGDDAILQSLVDQFPELDITATAGTLYSVADQMGIKTVRCIMNEGFSIKLIFKMLRDIFGILVALLRSDILFIGGGSLIHDLTSYNLPFFYLWHTIAYIAKKRIYYYTVGVGPLKTKFGRKLSAFFLKRSDVLLVRDRNSMDICKSINLKNAVFAPDGAFMLESARHPIYLDGIPSKDYVTVTACEWFESSNFWNKKDINFQNEILNLSECLKAVLNEFNKKLVFVPTVCHDYKLALKLKEHFSDEDFLIVSPSLSHMDMREIISNSYMLFGIRLHSMIFAASSGVPFIAAVYDKKVSELLEMLDISEYGIPLGDITPDRTAEIAKSLAGDYSRIQEKLKKKTSNLKDIINSGVTLIKGNIKGASATWENE